MKTIFKYTVNGGIIEMPEDSQILTVQHQEGVPTLWALVDTTKPLVQREFVIVGTGSYLNDDTLVYVGTSQNFGFVWHFFEKVLRKSSDDKTIKQWEIEKIQKVLDEAKKHGLQADVIWTALTVMKHNPTITISEAMNFAINDLI